MPIFTRTWRSTSKVWLETKTTTCEVARGSRSTDADFILVHADAHKHNVAETTVIILDENKRRAREFRTRTSASTRAVSSSKLSSEFLSTPHNNCWISGVEASRGSLLLGHDWSPTVTRCSSVSITAEQGRGRRPWRAFDFTLDWLLALFHDSDDTNNTKSFGHHDEVRNQAQRVDSVTGRSGCTSMALGRSEMQNRFSSLSRKLRKRPLGLRS